MSRDHGLCCYTVVVYMFAPVGKNGFADYCEGKLKIKSNHQIGSIFHCYKKVRKQGIRFWHKRTLKFNPYFWLHHSY